MIIATTIACVQKTITIMDRSCIVHEYLRFPMTKA